ncbi:Nudix hydrolase 15, mitochondrial [Basidiobolus ranarum]|uniref:Nudix hydrolase 15, mitochondrial n=1 Tax=Basidiobolus ranarum TaxID=34480 RepID=A0ABR2VLS3_9FUNG
MGVLEFGESFQASAIRETYEETGLELKGVSLVTVVNSLVPQHQEHYVLMLMKGTFIQENPIPKVRNSYDIL